jgi:hypothetical protein
MTAPDLSRLVTAFFVRHCARHAIVITCSTPS